MRDRKRKWPVPLMLAGLSFVLAGCRRPAEGFGRFVPGSETARAAVAAMLGSWRAGGPAGTVADARPVVHVVDKHRRPGQRLKRFEILGEVAAETDRARGFAVRLVLENPDERQVVRFLAVGLDPVWVFRQEDYEMISHWMHPMAEPGRADAAPSQPGPSQE